MLLKNNVKLAGRIPNFCNFIIIEKQYNQTNALWENREKGSRLPDSQNLRKPQV